MGGRCLAPDHRSDEGACVRATWVKVGPDQVDRGIDVYKSAVLPALEELEGFCSASLLVDWAAGRAVSSATYDSVAAMEGNRDRLDTLRAARAPSKQAQRCSTSATSSWRSPTYVCPRWPDRRTSAKRQQVLQR